MQFSALVISPQVAMAHRRGVFTAGSLRPMKGLLRRGGGLSPVLHSSPCQRRLSKAARAVFVKVVIASTVFIMPPFEVQVLAAQDWA